MYHPPSQRKQLIQRFVTYGIMTIAVLGLVTVLVFVMLGYQFNRTDGRIEQGGLVQFDSKPDGADVTIDGKNFGTRTASKTTTSAGQHFITMQKSGYQQWQKSVEVLPGSILWLNYSRLVPATLTPKNVADFTTISDTLVAPDAKDMAIQEDPAIGTIRLADLTKDEVTVKDIPLPVDSFTLPTVGKPHAFSLEKWDSDSRFILVKHSYDDNKYEWLVVDTDNPDATVNVTKLLDIDASKLIFSGNDSKILYAQTGTDIRRIDINAAMLSRPLVANVAEFSIYDDSTIVFTSLPNAETKKRSVGFYDSGSDKTHIIRSHVDDGIIPFRLALGKYFGETYAAVAYGDSIEVLKGDLTDTTKLRMLATVPLVGGAQYLAIVSSGRFVVAQNSANYAVYDIELRKATTTTLQGVAEVKDELRWLDDYNLWSDRDNMVRMYEFDGANQHELMPVTAGFSVTLSPDSKYLYGIIRSDTGVYHLERVRMIL